MASPDAMLLSDVTEIVMGQSPPGDSYNDAGRGLPFFQGKAEFGEVSPTVVKWCTDPKRVARNGDILLSVRAPVGPTNVASTECCIGRGLAAIRANPEKLVSGYLRYFLRHSETRLAGMGQGSTFSSIGRKEIAGLRIPLPKLEDQRRIVDLLSRAENIVRMRREAEKRTREIIPALFLEMFGNLGMNSNGGDAAGPREHGEGRREANSVVRLGDVAEVVSGVAKGRKLVGKVTREVPYLRVANVQAGGLDLAEMKYIPATADEIAELAVRSGDVLLTEGGDFDKVGRGALLEANIGECIHQNHVFRVRTHADRVIPEYFATYLQNSAARQYFLKAAKKTSNLASINMTQLRNLPLPLPRLEAQQEFQERFRACRALEKQQSDATGIADVSFQSLLAGVFSERQAT